MATSTGSTAPRPQSRVVLDGVSTGRRGVYLSCLVGGYVPPKPPKDILELVERSFRIRNDVWHNWTYIN